MVIGRQPSKSNRCHPVTTSSPQNEVVHDASKVNTLPDVVTECFVATTDFQNQHSLHKPILNCSVSIANFLIVAHPSTPQVLLLHPSSTPGARLELLWPALCTGAVISQSLVNHCCLHECRARKFKKQRKGFQILCVNPSTPRHHVDRDKMTNL